MLGADVVLADVDKYTLNITPEIVEKIVKTQDIKMVIVVDVAGLPVDIDALSELSNRYKFILIEDAAEALGSEYKNKKIGSFNHTSTFSFHAAKQITTGEGGCVSSNDEKIMKKIAQIRDQGRSTSGEYIHSEIGSNFRTTDIQSAIGIEQLKKIESFLESRNKIATEYKKNLKDVSFQQIPNYVSRHSFMMFFAIAENQEMRNKHLDALKSNQIDARISWLPLNCQPINEKFSNNDYPESENIYNNSLTLPIYNLMTSEEIKFVLDSWP